MFYSLRGKLINIESDMVAVECSGVGYACFVTLNTLKDIPRIGEEIMIYTHLHVREDAMTLFGFSHRGELNCFRILTSVSGVGVKVALAILSSLSAEQVAIAIASGDSKLLTVAPGVGNKLAQRIVLELKDKISGLSDGVVVSPMAKTSMIHSGKISQAIEALSVLGYSHSEAAMALSGSDDNLTVEELIKYGLKVMAGRL